MDLRRVDALRTSALSRRELCEMIAIRECDIADLKDEVADLKRQLRECREELCRMGASA